MILPRNQTIFSVSTLSKIILCSFGISMTFGGAISSANAATFFDEVHGSKNPEIQSFPNTVQNGDFLIRHPKYDDPTVQAGWDSVDIGDGFNENTLWTFDFTDNPDFATLSQPQTITSALLTLDLTTTWGIKTDNIQIRGLDIYPAEEIQSLNALQQERITLDLLDFYTSEEMMGVLTGQISDPNLTPSLGKLPMQYNDDAIVSYASLEIVTEEDPNNTTIPEPTMILGMLLSSVLVISARKK